MCLIYISINAYCWLPKCMLKPNFLRNRAFKVLCAVATLNGLVADQIMHICDYENIVCYA